jgi:zinc protease
VLGTPSALFEKLEAYRRVTKSDVLRVARRYLVNSARTVIEVFPDQSDGASGDEDDECDEEDGGVSRIARPIGSKEPS